MTAKSAESSTALKPFKFGGDGSSYRGNNLKLSAVQQSRQCAAGPPGRPAACSPAFSAHNNKTLRSATRPTQTHPTPSTLCGTAPHLRLESPSLLKAQSSSAASLRETSQRTWSPRLVRRSGIEKTRLLPRGPSEPIDPVDHRPPRRLDPRTSPGRAATQASLDSHRSPP